MLLGVRPCASLRHGASVYTDQLPALAGFAAAVSKAEPEIFPRDDYLFGLWRGDLIRHLLWSTKRVWYDSNTAFEGPHEFPFRLPSGYAPSWSFASLAKGSIRHHFDVEKRDSHTYNTDMEYETDTLVDVIATSCTPSTVNAFGPGTGQLSLKGILRPVKLRKPQKPKLQHHPRAALIRQPGSGLQYREGLMVDRDEHSILDFDWDADYYFLALVRWRAASEIHGILLARSQDVAEAFCRVGYAYHKQESQIEWRKLGIPDGEERILHIV